MKTLEELYKEVMASEEFKKEFTEAAKSKDTIAAWLKKHDCGATIEELGAFLKDKREGELRDEEVESVAGGKEDFDPQIADEIVFSMITVGVGCDVVIVMSAATDGKSVQQCMDETVDKVDDAINNL